MPTTKWLKSKPIIALSLVCLCIYVIYKSHSEEVQIFAYRDFIIEKFLEELPELNKKLPLQIDANTQLMSIQYENQKIINDYQWVSMGISNDNIPTIGAEIKKQFCLDELKRNLLDIDIEFLNRYQNSSGEAQFQVGINKSDCLALERSAH